MGTSFDQSASMRLKIIVLALIGQIYSQNEQSVFQKKKEADSVLKAKSDNKVLTQDEWNNELMFQLHLTHYDRWDEFLKPFVRNRGRLRNILGNPLRKCKKQCMKADKKSWYGGYGYEEKYEPWKETGFSKFERPVFPCSNCLTHLQIINPKWKRIVDQITAWKSNMDRKTSSDRY